MAAPQNTKPLSFKAVELMRPGDKVLADSGENRGLRVSCGNAGTKTFFYRYISPKTHKLVQVKLGRFPNMSLAEARMKLQELKDARRAGRCPAAELKEKKKERLAGGSAGEGHFTLKDLTDLYLTQYIEDRTVSGKAVRGARKPKGQSEVRRTLYGDLIPALGGYTADAITRKDIIRVVMEVVGRGSNVQAGNLLRELSAAYEFAIGLGRFDDSFPNPALLAKASLRQAKVKLTSTRGRRVLSERELQGFLQWLPGSAFTPTQKNVLRFTLWTGCRTGEVCNAEWADIDFETHTWHLRATKTDVERYVQLPRQAAEFLEQLKLVTGQHLFASQKTRMPIQQKSISEQAWRLRETGRMLSIEHWTAHDLRRTVRTGLSRLGCPNEVAEAVLGHARSGIEGTYDLHGYEVECRQWLQKWADYLDDLSK